MRTTLLRTLVCVLPLMPSSVRAQLPGSLDLSFGTAGVAELTAGQLPISARSFAIQADQKIVVIGGMILTSYTMALARCHTDGTADISFGNMGVVVPEMSTDLYPLDVAIQPDQKIVVLGTGDFGNYLLLRYNTDGTPDESFGVAGVVDYPLPNASNNDPRSLVIQPDGNILVAGSADVGMDGGSEVVLVRFGPDGTPDPSFGAGGFVVTSTGPLRDFCYAVALQADGKIIAVGCKEVTTAPNEHFALEVLRYDPDGTLDNSFGGDGIIIGLDAGDTSRAYAVAIRPDQRIDVAGYKEQNGLHTLLSVRYLSDGSLDNTLNGTGYVSLDSISAASAVCIQSDGKVLLSGQGYLGSIVLARYNVDGSLDGSFGNLGLVLTGPAYELYGLGSCMALQADERIVVGGYITSFSGSYPTLLRFLSGVATGIDPSVGIAISALVYPDPVETEAVLVYELAAPEELTCTLFDAQGRSVRRLFANSPRTVGQHRETLDLSGLAAAHYTLVLSNGVGRVNMRVVKQ